MATRITNARILSMRLLSLVGVTAIPNSHSHAIYLGAGTAGVINADFKHEPGVFVLIDVSEYMTAHLELNSIDATGTTFVGNIYALKME